MEVFFTFGAYPNLNVVGVHMIQINSFFGAVIAREPKQFKRTSFAEKEVPSILVLTFSIKVLGSTLMAFH